MESLTINGTPLEDYGLDVVRPLKGWADAPSLQFPTIAIPGRLEHLGDADALTAEPRVLEIRVKAKPSVLATRKALLAALYAIRGTAQLVFADAEDRYVNAKLLSAPGDGPAGGEMVDPQVYATLRFVAIDPWYYAVALDTRHLVAGIPVLLPVGESGARAELYLTGVTSSTVVTVASGRTGLTIGTLTLTGSLTSAQSLRLRLDTRRLGVVSGATETDAYGWKGTTDLWPAIDAADLPTIAISAGDGLLVSRKVYPV